MSEKLYDEVPSLDLSDFTSGNTDKKNAFVQALGAAYNNIGFVAIKNHGLSDQLTEQLYTTIKRFFDLTEEVKSNYEIPDLAGQRGYIGKGKEHAKGRTTGDLKEFYHVGQNVTDGDNIKDQYPDNIWPNELPELEQVCLEAYRTLESTGTKMLQAIALYLGMDEHYFDKKVHNGNSILRPIHYFPIENPDEVPADARCTSSTAF